MNSQSSEQQKMGFRDLIKSNKKSLIILCIIIFFLGAVFFLVRLQ